MEAVDVTLADMTESPSSSCSKRGSCEKISLHSTQECTHGGRSYDFDLGGHYKRGFGVSSGCAASVSCVVYCLLQRQELRILNFARKMGRAFNMVNRSIGCIPRSIRPVTPREQDDGGGY